MWVGSHALATRDVRAGAHAAVEAIARALEAEGSSIDDLVRIGVYSEEQVPDPARPVVNLLPVREPGLPGAPVVVDAAAASGPRATFGDGDYPNAVRVGDRIWVGGTRGTGPDILEQTRDVIARLRSAAAFTSSTI